MAQNARKTITGHTSLETVHFDNSYRQTLGIVDPTDAGEFAEGLLRFYEGEQQVLAMEEAGLPYVKEVVIETDVGGSTVSDAEVVRALADVERDIKALTGDPLLKDVQAELEGWGIAIRKLCKQGLDAAELAADPSQFNLAFLSRSGLRDHSRVERYTGVLSLGANRKFRELAQSLDVVGNLILVKIGEALAQTGTQGGRFRMQAAHGDLRSRGQAVITAFNALQGTVGGEFTGDVYNRGLEALLQISRDFSDSGHADIKALFSGHALAQLVEDMQDAVTGSTARGLRQLGATAQFRLQQLRRLVFAAQQAVAPTSPPARAFISAVRYFLEAFENSGSGTRLLFVARPAILLYGAYRGDLEFETTRLLPLVLRRARLAELADCFLDCRCDEEHLRAQILIDKVLYDVDRAIDLFALSSPLESPDEPFVRAQAYGAVVKALREIPAGKVIVDDSCFGGVLADIQGILGWSDDCYPEGCKEMHDEICLQYRAESHWEQLVERMVPGCRKGSVWVGDGSGRTTVIEQLLAKALSDIDRCERVALSAGWTGPYDLCKELDEPAPPPPANSQYGMDGSLKRLTPGEYGDGGGDYGYAHEVEARRERGAGEETDESGKKSAKHDKKSKKAARDDKGE